MKDPRDVKLSDYNDELTNSFQSINLVSSSDERYDIKREYLWNPQNVTLAFLSENENNHDWPEIISIMKPRFTYSICETCIKKYLANMKPQIASPRFDLFYSLDKETEELKKLRGPLLTTKSTEKINSFENRKRRHGKSCGRKGRSEFKNSINKPETMKFHWSTSRSNDLFNLSPTQPSLKVFSLPLYAHFNKTIQNAIDYTHTENYKKPKIYESNTKLRTSDGYFTGIEWVNNISFEIEKTSTVNKNSSNSENLDNAPHFYLVAFAASALQNWGISDICLNPMCVPSLFSSISAIALAQWTSECAGNSITDEELAIQAALLITFPRVSRALFVESTATLAGGRTCGINDSTKFPIELSTFCENRLSCCGIQGCVGCKILLNVGQQNSSTLWPPPIMGEILLELVKGTDNYCDQMLPFASLVIGSLPVDLETQNIALREASEVAWTIWQKQKTKLSCPLKELGEILDGLIRIAVSAVFGLDQRHFLSIMKKWKNLAFSIKNQTKLSLAVGATLGSSALRESFLNSGSGFEDWFYYNLKELSVEI